MTAPIEESGEVQRISGVKIAENARHEPIITVHVYTGTDETELNRTRLLAIKTYQDTQRDLGNTGRG